MHSESVIFSAIYAFFTRLKTSYEKSAYHMAFCRLFDIIGAFFGKILNKLLFFGKYSHGNNVFAGIANSGIQFFHRIFGGMAKSLMQKSEESFLVRTANLVFNSWHLISVRSYSEVLLAFTLVRLAIVRAVGRVNDKYTLVFLIASAIGLCIPASFSGLYQGSLLRRQMGLYDLKNPSLLSLKIKPHTSTTCSLSAGALLGLAILLPYWHIFVLCVIGIIFVFIKPNLSALLIVAICPAVSQNTFFVLAVILGVVWIILHFAGDRSKLDIDGLDVCVIFIIIAAICSAAASPVIKSSIGYGSVILLFAVLYFILRRAFTDKNNIRLFIDFLILVCGTIAFSMLYTMTFVHSVFDKDSFSLLHSVEQSLRNADISGKNYGMLFAVVMPFALCRIKTHRALFGKILYFVVAVLMSICVFVSYRQYMPLLIFAVLMTVITDFRRMASFIACPLIIIACFAIYRALGGNLNLVRYIPESFAPLHKQGLWQMLVYGVGIGTDALNAAYASFTDIPSNISTMNLYTSVLFASGIAGILIFAITVRTAFSYANMATQLSPDKKTPFSNAFAISLATFIFSGFLPAKTYCTTAYMLFFAFAAMAGSMLDKAKTGEVK